MKIKDTYSLIYIGLQIRLLRNISIDNEVNFVLDNIKTLEEELEESELFVSLNAVKSLNLFRITITELEKLDKNTKITKAHQSAITDQMRIIEAIVFSEATTKKIYVIPQRRYNEKYLLDEPHKLLKENVFDKFTDICKFDFTAASRCLSLGEGTACAFHILRATEDTLKAVYFHFKKTNRLDKPMWGPMTNQLRSKREPKPDNTILDTLDVIRNSYRNPTQHPQVTYDIDSAQDLFGLCIDCLNKMTQYL